LPRGVLDQESVVHGKVNYGDKGPCRQPLGADNEHFPLVRT